MLEDLHSGRKVVGVRQLRKALSSGQCRQVFLALDADPFLTAPIRELCQNLGVPLADVPTMTELGRACGISVGAAAAGLLS